MYDAHVGPVSLDYERDNTSGRNSEKELFNDYVFVIRARAESGEDLHLWMFTYRYHN
jgi:hypothetical protein